MAQLPVTADQIDMSIFSAGFLTTTGAQLPTIVPANTILTTSSQVTNVNLTRTGITAAGTVYTLTATSAAIAFGTTSPSLTLPALGTWAFWVNVNTAYTGASFLAVQTLTYKLRSVTTSTDLPDITHQAALSVVTTLTAPATPLAFGPVLYTSSTANEVISLFGNISALPTLGSIQTSAATIIGLRLSP